MSNYSFILILLVLYKIKSAFPFDPFKPEFSIVIFVH